MKKTLKIVSVFVGMVIGAGFASGREIMEYFNFSSNSNAFGVVIASLLFSAVTYLILSKAEREKLSTYSEYIDSVAGKMASGVRGFMLIYMFCGLFVMFSGSGALIYSLSVFPKIAGVLAMALLCFIVISFDLKGIVTLNLIVVPIMILGIIYVAVCSAVFGSEMTFMPSGGRSMTLSSVCYVAYNTVTAGAVLVPLAKNVTGKNIKAAALIGGFVVGLLITIVWTVQGMNFKALWDSELPMLELAALCGRNCKRVYSAVLFMAISTTAVSHGFGLMSHFSDKIKNVRDRMFFSAVICLGAIPPALCGFSTLVANLYSFFGYVGMAWMIWIAVDRFKD